MTGGCTITKGFSAARRARQRAAIGGPLQDFWKKSGKHFRQKPEVLRRIHGLTSGSDR